MPPSSSGCPRLPVSSRGCACGSWLVLLSPLFCERAWWCLMVRAFSGIAIPRSGLLSQVSSLRLPSGHSGPVLTLSNAAHASLPSPRLLVKDAGVCTASPLGVTIGHWACNLWVLIIYFSSRLCCPLRLQGLPDSPVRVFPGVWKVLSFLRLPSRN